MKQETRKDPAIPLLGMYSREPKILNWKDIYIQVYCSIVYNSHMWKQSKCPSINEWMKKWCIYSMENDSAIKNEILPSATTRMDPKGILLRWVRQRKTNARWFHIYVESRNKINKQAEQKETYRNRGHFNGCQMKGEVWGWVENVKWFRSTDR